MKHRSEFYSIYIAFRAMIQTQYSSVIKCFRCDLGGEYCDSDFLHLLQSDGTLQQSSCAETPEQNGVVECKHRHIMETASSLLISSSVPNSFGGRLFLLLFILLTAYPPK